MNWTDDQRKVIETRKRNILVSAAAGSGKTAVLVARIMSLILDPDDPADIDELLIVTFTRAAAAEMKSRILKAVAEEMEKDPGNRHLADQLSLIHNAEITTIDGFCSRVVREYGHTRGVTPGFRVANDGELRLLKSETADRTIEEAYAGELVEKERFDAFADTYVTGRNDSVLAKLLIRVSDAADSEPDPYKWLNSCRSDSDETNGEAFVRECLRDVYVKTGLIRQTAEENLRCASLPGGPSAYLKAAGSDLSFAEELCRERDYDRIRVLAENWTPERLSSAKPAPGEDPVLREKFKKRRELLKKYRKSLSEGMYPVNMEQARIIQDESGKVTDVLIELTLIFREKLREAKKRRNIMDFADLEHEALSILAGPEGRTEAAAELSSRFREIMVDEYQDSNYLQEAILLQVSRLPEGSQNYFTVGDDKQSIYSFRQARPELFLEKYSLYRKDPEKGRRIDLSRNFRSRREVIDTVNSVFSAIMIPETGGIPYDEDSRLVFGADYPESGGFETEVIPVFSGEKDDEGQPLLEGGSDEKVVLEAGAIGARILELVKNGRIYDASEGGMRGIRYGDIAVLLRSVKGISDQVVSTFMSMGIPAYSETRTGYFDAPEVQAVLCFLEILDNPRQDIPFAAVLRSGFLGLDAEELASVTASARAAAPEKREILLRDAVYFYAESGEKEELREKLKAFLAFYESLRDRLSYTPVHELVSSVLTETGYLSFVSAMPGGEQRTLNLRLLEDQALEYESTSYSGLFNFVRYIRNLEKQDADPGEVSILPGNGDVVRILSVHKSKGLEYPVVFVSGLGRKFNRRSASENPLIHHAFGIAADHVDLLRRVKIPTIRKTAAASRIRQDAAGEEIRVLYVALTRARQKLILTGTVRDEEALNERLNLMDSEGPMSAGYLLTAGCFFDWILPVCGRVLRETEKNGSSPFLRVTPVKPSDLIFAEAEAGTGKEAAFTLLRQTGPGSVFDRELRDELERRFSFRYPFEGRENIPVEISVSEIKRRMAEVPGDDDAVRVVTEEFYPAEEERRTVPEFMVSASGEEQRERQPLTAAERGTAYHRAMELLDYAALPGEDGTPESSMEARIAEMVSSGRLSEREAETLDPKQFVTFIESRLGGRMRRAALSGKLRREQPFVLAMPASRISPEWPEDEDIFVQGIIDAYFPEDDGIVLVDYKTDRVRPGQENELAERYRVQLLAYREALERASGKRVTETYIWSAALGTEIRVF